VMLKVSLCCQCLCVRDLRRELIRASLRGTEIELLTAAPPPAGRPPNIRGTVLGVSLGAVALCLTTGPRNRVGVFSLCHIIGFVPRDGDDEED
jgi:hypothetical protein